MDTSGQLRLGDHMPMEAASLVMTRFWNIGSVGFGIGTARVCATAGAAVAQVAASAKIWLRERRPMLPPLVTGTSHRSGQRDALWLWSSCRAWISRAILGSSSGLPV